MFSACLRKPVRRMRNKDKLPSANIFSSFSETRNSQSRFDWLNRTNHIQWEIRARSFNYKSAKQEAVSLILLSFKAKEESTIAVLLRHSSPSWFLPSRFLALDVSSPTRSSLFNPWQFAFTAIKYSSMRWPNKDEIRTTSLDQANIAKKPEIWILFCSSYY